MSDVLQRVRGANPIVDLDDVDAAEFEMALAAIEDRWEFGDKPPRLPAARRSEWMRPALAAAGAALLVILAIAAPMLYLRGEEHPVTDTTVLAVTTTTAIVTTTLPATTTVPVPTTVPAPVAAPPSITWMRVPNDPSFDQAVIWSVATGGPGLIATGASTGDDIFVIDGIVWVSEDGASWTRIDDPSFATSVPHDQIGFGNVGIGIRDAAAGPSGVVAVGFDGDDTATWFSPDGLEWSRVEDEAIQRDGFVNLLAVTTGGPGWVAVGDVDMDGGIWVSEDGHDWMLVEDEDLLASDRIDVTIYDVATWNGGLIAAGSVGLWDGTGDRASHGAVWVSEDGIEWQELDEASFAEARVFEGVSVDPSTNTAHVFGSPGGVWSSADGGIWEVITFGSLGGPPPSSGVVWDGDRAVAGGPDMALSLWTSGDSGNTWLRVDPSNPAFDGYSPGVADVTRFRDRFIVVGSAGDYNEEVGAIWIGTWDE